MLFDKEFEFTGKHAEYCRFLRDKIFLFKTFREAYVVSAIIGFINGNKVAPDRSDFQPASVFPNELAKKRADLTYLYRLMMLLEDTPGFTTKDYQDRTFRDDADADAHPEKLKENMALFNSYAIGGIEILYEKFKDCDDIKDTVNTLNDYLLEFFEDNELI